MEIILVVAIICAFVFGRVVGKAEMRLHLTNILRAAEVKITLSKHQGTIYAHDELTGAFLTQGSTMEELSEKLTKLDDSKTFIAKGSEIKTILESDDIRVG